MIIIFQAALALIDIQIEAEQAKANFYRQAHDTTVKADEAIDMLLDKLRKYTEW